MYQIIVITTCDQCEKKDIQETKDFNDPPMGWMKEIISKKVFCNDCVKDKIKNSIWMAFRQ